MYVVLGTPRDPEGPINQFKNSLILNKRKFNEKNSKVFSLIFLYFPDEPNYFIFSFTGKRGL